jgi:hypothetical protein
MRKHSQNEIADYLNNFEQRKRFMDNVKKWSIVFFFITYGYLLIDKGMSEVFPVEHTCKPCNTATAIDSVKTIYQHKMDSIINKKRRK